MDPVDSLQVFRDRIFFWEGYEAAVKADLSCSAVRTATGLVVIDPVPLAPEPLDELVADGPPVAIILTNGNHQRATLDFRRRFGCPIFAHAAARAEVVAGETLAGGQTVHGLDVIDLPGSGAGEIGLHTADLGLLILGDAIINLAPEGLRFLPAKYCVDPAAARVSLRALRTLAFDTLCVAHGPPIPNHADERVTALLDSDQA